MAGTAERPASENKTGAIVGKLLSSILIFLIMGLALLPAPGPVDAKTFTVTSNVDETDAAPGDGICATLSAVCTLRAAIQEANALAGPDTIILNKGLYLLVRGGRGEDDAATGDLDIRESLTIKGKGAKKTYINANKLDRVFHVIGSITVNISDVTIQNGLATESGSAGLALGGGILNDAGTVNLTKCTISDNTAANDSAWGGGMYNYNYGIVTVKSSMIFNNVARGTVHAYGGGIDNENGTLTVTGTTISGNSASSTTDLAAGGGIYSGDSGHSTVTQSTVSGNAASGPVAAGGGIYGLNSTVMVTSGGVAGNSASGTQAIGGGLYVVGGTLTLTHVAVSHNIASGATEGFGGGILNSGSVVTVAQSTVTYNAAKAVTSQAFGGGLHNSSGTAIITGGSFSDNSASGIPGAGGGISNIANLTIEKAAKIIQNFASDGGGGIHNMTGTVNISADSMVTGNIPNDRNF